MKNIALASSALALMSTTALAGGLDRNGQPIGIIFEKGTYAEFSLAHTSPTLNGTDLAAFGGRSTGDVANSFVSLGAGYKTDFNDKLSFALIYDQPWGVDVEYPTGSSVALGGTSAEANSDALTALLRYKLNDRFSVHGGLRYQQIDGEITLSGAAYGPFSGYNVKVNNDGAFGWSVGGAYEIPEIALRLAVTYNSEIEHNFDLNEALPAALGGATADTNFKTKTPQTVNVDFQTGIADDTLLLAGVRWAQHSKTKLAPTAINGFGTPVDLVNLDDTITYTIGVGRRFNENWSGSLSYIYESGGDDDLVSPLAPTNGMRAIRLGVQYQQDKFKIAAGLRYTMLGDARAETGTPDTARAVFDDSKAVSFGFKVGYYF